MQNFIKTRHLTMCTNFITNNRCIILYVCALLVPLTLKNTVSGILSLSAGISQSLTVSSGPRSRAQRHTTAKSQFARQEKRRTITHHPLRQNPQYEQNRVAKTKTKRSTEALVLDARQWYPDIIIKQREIEREKESGHEQTMHSPPTNTQGIIRGARRRPAI